VELTKRQLLPHDKLPSTLDQTVVRRELEPKIKRHSSQKKEILAETDANQPVTDPQRDSRLFYKSVNEK
jgi:hypothetical protein